MKKLLSIMSIFLIVLSGCNFNHDQDNTSKYNQVDDDVIIKIDGKTSDSFDTLSSLIDDFNKKVSEHKDDDLESFFDFKKEANRIEIRLDQFEDEIEDLYRDKTITRNQYKQLERKLESLEDNLDQIEDSLKSIYKIDD